MTDGIGPWVELSSDMEELLDDLAAQCRDLVGAWFAVGRSPADLPSTDTPQSGDVLFLASAAGDAPAGLARAPGHYAAQYVDAISQHLQAVVALLDARQVTLALWPIVRAQLELAGRVGWLLDPGVEDVPLNGLQRVARFLIEGLGSLYRAKYTASRIGQSRLEKQLKSHREHMRADLESLFPGAALPMESPDDIKLWVVGGEISAPLTKAVDAFARRHLGDARGLYDVVSDYSHPSPYHLGLQTTYAEMAGRLELQYVVPPQTIEWQVQLACLVLYRAAHLVVGYLGSGEQPLEEWAEKCAERFPAWFNPIASAGRAD